MPAKDAIQMHDCLGELDIGQNRLVFWAREASPVHDAVPTAFSVVAEIPVDPRHPAVVVVGKGGFEIREAVHANTGARPSQIILGE